MEWSELKQLVDGWHEAASRIPDYQDTTDAGEGIQLLLFAKRSKEGDIVLQVMAAKDWISTISPASLLQPADIATADEPTIPVASLRIRTQT